MIVSSINSNSSNPSFQYSNVLKTLYKKGKLPSVQFDVMGNKLTRKNVTLDHIIPRSKGGKSSLENYMLATKDFNNKRGADPIDQWANMKGVLKYLMQFADVNVGNFKGNDYIKSVMETLGKVFKFEG